MTPEKRDSVGYLKEEHRLSERRACEAVSLSRRVFRYVPQRKDDAALIEVLSRLARDHPDLGFGKFFYLLRAEGHEWNHKRVHRVYCGIGLNKRPRRKRRLPARHPEPLSVPNALNRCWSADFMSDALGDGRRFRTFNVIDDHRREVLKIEIGLNLGSRRVLRVLDRIAEMRGLPERIRFDNGPEFTSIAVADWAERNGVELEFIKPGRPMQNGFIERFNRTYRQAILDRYIFDSLDEVRELTSRWIDFYNHRRPHDLRGSAPPSESNGPVLINPNTPV